jgi:hypothetical protein
VKGRTGKRAKCLVDKSETRVSGVAEKPVGNVFSLLIFGCSKKYLLRRWMFKPGDAIVTRKSELWNHHLCFRLQPFR